MFENYGYLKKYKVDSSSYGASGDKEIIFFYYLGFENCDYER